MVGISDGYAMVKIAGRRMTWTKTDAVYDGFSTKQEAFKEACTLACKEAYTQNEEAAHERTCMVYFDAANGIIRLHYTYDGTFCQYEVIPVNEEEKEI